MRCNAAGNIITLSNVFAGNVFRYEHEPRLNLKELNPVLYSVVPELAAVQVHKHFVISAAFREISSHPLSYR